MNHKVPAWVELLDGELAPVRDLAARLGADGFSVDPASGSLLISHRPRNGAEAFACTLFPGVASDVVARYEDIQQAAFGYTLAIPALYRQVLQRLNGASLFGVSLYGLPTSMSQSPPFVDRSSRQPLDLGSAQQHWRRGYKAKPDQFYFGSSPYSWEQNVGYFLNEDGSVEAFLKGGELAWKWPSISTFLLYELARAEPFFASFEQRQSNFVKPLTSKKRK